MEHDWCVSQGGKGAVVTGKGENDRFQVFWGKMIASRFFGA